LFGLHFDRPAVTNGSDWTKSDATRSFGDSVSGSFTLHAGQQFGPFAIVGPLGSGGMGEVYEAEELESGRHVALKVLSRSLATVDHARFIREGRLAAGISHPHTIYIYGTDEIEGVPVIAMELAPGGTLRDLVKQRGSLPPARAVDVILQVVAGLEAAADAGVLHRDIKPSNCFVDSDGTVKVGDFGLSISTLTTDERSLTMFGTVLGTPAFASPEQLRGDDLDVRSDIYSVGATLYYLLTGRAPFEDTNIVRLVTQVAQEMPSSPRAIRPDIPKALAAVVMRCLAKRSSERYASYDDLRAALEPFSAAAPRPASPGIRFLAGLVDMLILATVAFPILTWLWDPLVPGQREGMVPASLATWVVDIAYYGIWEGRWGRSLGKQLFGLRVIDESRQPPGLPRALARATLWTIGVSAPMLAYGYAMAPFMAASQNTPLGGLLGFSFPLLSLALAIAMFIPARRGNGYAGLHDLATGTRIVVKRGAEGRALTALRVADQPAPDGSVRTGPYVMLEERPFGGDHVLVGYDDRLRRRVWIRPAQLGEPHVPAARRTLSRSARLRWLSGRRTETEAWDAYEAVDGLPLVALLRGLGRPHPWSAVRLWLVDLAAEIRAGLADRSLPPLAPGRVWVTNAGRARLLDWSAEPAPASQQGEPPQYEHRESDKPDFAAAQTFLYDVGALALDPARGPQSRQLQVTLPLGARSFFDRLERRSFDSAESLTAEAAALAREPATFGRGRRIAHLAFCSLPQVLFALFLTGLLLTMTATLMADRDLGDLSECLQRLAHLNELPEETRQARASEIRAFELYTAARHRARVEDRLTWSQGWSPVRFNPQLKAVAHRAVLAHPHPTPEDMRAAETVVRPYLEQERMKLERTRSPLGILAWLLLFGTLASVIVAGLGLLSALIFRGGLGLRLFGAAVLTSRGSEARRVRAFGRALIAWSPAALGVVGVVLAPEPLVPELSWMILCASSVTLLVIGAVYAVRHPDHGLQDRIAGTALVPR